MRWHVEYDSAFVAAITARCKLQVCHSFAIQASCAHLPGCPDPWSSSVPWAFWGLLGEAAPNGVDSNPFARGIGAARLVEPLHARAACVV